MTTLTPSAASSPRALGRPGGRAGMRPTGPAGPAPGGPGGVRPPQAGRQDPLALVRALAVAFVEAESGRRSPRQVEALLDAALVLRLEDHWRRRRPPARVRRVRVTVPTAGVIEAVAVVVDAARARALVLRIERREGRWVVTEAAGPEGGVGRADGSGLVSGVADGPGVPVGASPVPSVW